MLLRGVIVLFLFVCVCSVSYFFNESLEESKIH